MEFDFSLNASSPKPSSTGPRYASDDGIAYSLSSEEMLFQSRRTGENHVMTREVFMAMSQTRAFRTLDGHVQAIAQAQPALARQPGAVRKVLEALVSRKIMLEETDLIDSLRGSAPHTTAPFAGLVIRTCDRPGRLERLLTSLAENASFQEQSMAVHVVDDSRQDEHRKSNKAVCQTHGARYLGVAEQSRYLEQLADRAGVDIEPARWLAAGRGGDAFTGGRVLNLIALLFAGFRYALLDDDYVYAAQKANEVNDRELVLAANGGTQVHFAPSAKPVERLGAKLEQDLLAEHRDLVGQSLGTVIDADRFEKTAIAGLSVTDCRHITSDSRVLLTHQGVWRHARSEQPFWLYVLKGQSRDEFAADRETYLKHRTTPLILQTAPRWSMHRSPRFLPLAVDGSNWLPPTLPEGRAEDLLFNTLLLALHPGGQALEAPYALEHGREAQHSYTDSQRQCAMTPGLATLMTDFIDVRVEQCEASSPQSRFHWILSQLEDLCAADPARHTQFVREYLGWVRGDFIGQLQAQATDWKDVPVHWQADAQAMIKANARALLQSDDLRLADTPADCSAGEVVSDTITRIGAWLDAARHWPALWQTALDQGSVEQRLQAF